MYIDPDFKEKMSNELSIEDLLLKITFQLENMPIAICDEMERRQEVRKQLEIKRMQDDMDFYHSNLKEINKMMYGVKDNDEQ